jgi:hypothetical protein
VFSSVDYYLFSPHNRKIKEKALTARADLTVYVRFILANYENVTVSFLSLS